MTAFGLLRTKREEVSGGWEGAWSLEGGGGEAIDNPKEADEDDGLFSRTLQYVVTAKQLMQHYTVSKVGHIQNSMP